jgi:hypothetical protein
MTDRKSTDPFQSGFVASKVGTGGRDELTVEAFFARLKRDIKFTDENWDNNQCTASDESSTLVFGSSRTFDKLLNYVNVKRTMGGDDANFARVIHLVVGLIDPDFVAAQAEMARAIDYMSSRGINDRPSIEVKSQRIKYTFRMEQSMLMMEAEARPLFRR